eukprot:357528-Chlamydomonas_euryale.AAC.2
MGMDVWKGRGRRHEHPQVMAHHPTDACKLRAHKCVEGYSAIAGHCCVWAGDRVGPGTHMLFAKHASL